VKTYAELFEMHGFGGRLAGIRDAFMDGGGEPLVEAVGAEMTARFSVAGARAEVREELARRAPSADRLWLTVPHHQQDADALARWQRSLIETLGR
ncbi:MAG: hypothetical protein ACR2N6_00855, partial [Miltoncostaeaceae bacterium]